MIVCSVLWHSIRLCFRENKGVSMIFLQDYFIPGSFSFIRCSFSKLLCDGCLGHFQGICLKSSLESDCSIELPRSPVDFWVDSFQEWVTKEYLVAIYFSHKEGVLASVSFVANFQNRDLSHCSSFVGGAVHVFYLSRFL